MQKDLNALSNHPDGRQVIEQRFFGEVDDKAAKAIRRMLVADTACLTNEERCDFARLLLSLDSRRPANISKLKSDGSAYLKTSLDNDNEIKSVMAKQGIDGTPSELFEKLYDQNLVLQLRIFTFFIMGAGSVELVFSAPY